MLKHVNKLLLTLFYLCSVIITWYLGSQNHEPAVLGGVERKNVFIQVRIKEKTELGDYQDSIYYTPEEWKNKTDADIQSDIEQRVSKWIQFVKEQSNKE